MNNHHNLAVLDDSITLKTYIIFVSNKQINLSSNQILCFVKYELQMDCASIARSISDSYLPKHVEMEYFLQGIAHAMAIPGKSLHLHHNRFLFLDSYIGEILCIADEFCYKSVKVQNLVCENFCALLDLLIAIRQCDLSNDSCSALPSASQVRNI